MFVSPLESRVVKGNVTPPTCAARGTDTEADHVSPSLRGTFPAPTKANRSTVKESTAAPEQGAILAIRNCASRSTNSRANRSTCDSSGDVRTAALVHNFVGVKDVLAS